MHQLPLPITMSIDKAIGGVDAGVLILASMAGMSPGLKNTINNIRTTVQGLPEANMGMADSWQRQINAAAQREAHPTDQIVAGKIDSALDGLIQQGGAGGLQNDAQAAYQRSAMAENLADWHRKAAAGAPLGQAPLTEAETYFQGTPKYQPLVDLYQKSQSQQDPSWAMGHIAAGAIGDLAGASGLGFLGHLGGEALGYIGVKPMIKSAMKGVKQNALGRNIQSLYPQYTGVPLSGGTQAPQISPRTGDMIKNLMLGTARLDDSFALSPFGGAIENRLAACKPAASAIPARISLGYGWVEKQSPPTRKTEGTVRRRWAEKLPSQIGADAGTLRITQDKYGSGDLNHHLVSSHLSNTAATCDGAAIVSFV